MRHIHLFIAVLLGAVALAGCSTSSDGSLNLDASINGVALEDGDRGDPIELVPEEPVLVEMTVDNTTSSPVDVRHVRLEGEILEMRFAHANTAVDFTVEPNSSRDFAIEIDFFDLGEQVTGDIDAVLSLHDDDRTALAAEQFFANVDGNAASSLGATTLMVGLFAALSLLANLAGVARRNLPVNRLYRGLRFAFTGFAVALFVLLILPFVGHWLPPAGVWIPVMIIATLGAYFLGYSSPGPDHDADEDLMNATVAA